MHKLYLFLFLTVLFFAGCGREEQRIGDLIPTTGEVIVEETEIVQPELSVGVSASSMPDWVKSLGFLEPDTMYFNSSVSRQTRQEVEGYNSVSLVYTGAYEVAMQEAKRIADAAGVLVSKDFAMVQELLENGDGVSTTMNDVFEGIVYTNHGLTDTNIDIIKSITVEKDGTLIIDIVDYAAMNKK